MKKPKTPKARANQRAKPVARGASRRRAFIGILLVGVCLGFGVWLLVFRERVAPPTVSLTALDPALRQLIETSRVAVVRAPKSGAAWGRFAEALQAAEFLHEAQLCYSNAAARDPQNFRWPYLLGLLQLKGDGQSALHHLARATELSTRHDSPRFQLARALVEQGQFEKAAPHLELLLAANPNHMAARVEMARVHLARGALREATLTLQPALTNQYTMRPGLLLASQIAQRNGQTELAAGLSRRASGLPRPFDWPDPVLREVQALRLDREYLADQANALLQQQRFPEAEATLTRLLNAFPDYPEGVLLFGRLRFMERRCSEAEAAFRKHLELRPDSLNGFIQLGLALMCQQQWTNAAAVFEKAVAMKPDFAQGHLNLATARANSGDSAGAIRAFRDGLRCNPGDINAHLNLAEELANVGQLEEAKEHVRRAGEINPQDSRVLKARQQLGIN